MKTGQHPGPLARQGASGLCRIMVLVCLLLLSLRGQHAFAQTQVSVEALMPGMVVLTIDGVRHTLKRGATAAGVTLIDATAEKAVVEIAGQQRMLSVSDRVSGAFSAPALRQIDIPRNERMQYQTTALINGRRVDVLVDTGANIVAMNAAQAQRLGIAPGAGQPARVETAGNALTGRTINLDSVDVGGIRVDNVLATVL